MLPDLIEVSPPRGQKELKVVLPGSKSITNRALVVAALASAPVEGGALWSEDTQAMVECLGRLGFGVGSLTPGRARQSPLTVAGAGGRIPSAGTPEKPLELLVGNAGTAARFLPAMVCLGQAAIASPASRACTSGRRPPCSRRCGSSGIASTRRRPAARGDSRHGPRPGRLQGQRRRELAIRVGPAALGRIGGWRVSIAGANRTSCPGSR